MTDPTPSPRSREDRTWGAACHAAALLALVLPGVPGAGILGPLAIWLARRDDNAFVDEQGRAAVNFQISMALLTLAAWPLVLVLVGIPLLWAILFIDVLFVLVATVRVATGGAWRYPFTMELVKARERPAA